MLSYNCIGYGILLHSVGKVHNVANEFENTVMHRHEGGSHYREGAHCSKCKFQKYGLKFR